MTKKLLTIAVIAGLAACSGQSVKQTLTDQANKVTATAPASLAGNPFMQESGLMYDMPAFDRIQDEHFLPAINEGMRQHLAEIHAIVANPEPANFANTIEAMERAGGMLGRVLPVFYNLSSADTNKTRQAVMTEISPKMAAHRDAITLNDALFQRVKAVYDQRNSLGLDAESKHLVEKYYEDFTSSGAELSDADKETLKGYNGQLAKLQTKFSQNVLAEVNKSAIHVKDKSRLKGLTDGMIASAAKAAKDRNMDGYVIALTNTTQQPPLELLEDRSLREQIYKASVARGTSGGEFDNREVIRNIAKLRAQRAELLGFDDFASGRLTLQTAKNKKAVNDLLYKLAPAAVANAKKEAADLQRIIDREGGGFKLQPWDWNYYTAKLRAERYNFDSAELKPYFEFNNVLENGVLYAAEKVYGLTFKKRPDLPTYHPDVTAYEVFDADGTSMAIFLADMYARPSKRGGAWMNSYVDQSKLLGKQPVVGQHLNIPKPADGQPTLMTYDEVNTLFHEFGHALHGILSNVKYPRFSGTSVPRDFVEYPSQVNEMWMTWPDILKNYAKHYKTGEPIPAKLLERVQAASKFNQGYATTEYLAASLLDQKWHQLPSSQIPDDVLAFEKAALADAGVDFYAVPPRYRTGYFSHVWGSGYAAGYYSYIWSEVLDAETVEWFKENGGMNRKNGDIFRNALLSRGGSMDAMSMFRSFRHRDPKIEPLLKRRGLDNAN